MSKFRWFLSLFLVFGLAVGVFAAGANAPWGSTDTIKVGVVVQSGVGISAWAGGGSGDVRNDITGNATSFFLSSQTEMTPMGDGTYQLRVDLIPNAVYNYIFKARIVSNTTGFSAGTEIAEPVPNGSQTDDGGNIATSDPGFFISSNSAVYADPNSGSVSYAEVGPAKDGRRKIIMPDVTPGVTIYIFNNFASIPCGVANYSAIPGLNYAELSWQGALGRWGAGTGSPDCLGGGYSVYMSTSNQTGPYVLQASLAGYTTYYRRVGLIPATSYYFIVVSSDSYNGVTRSSYTAVKAMWANLARQINTAYGTNSYSADETIHNDKMAKPNTTTPVYFKVENIDEEYVKQHGNIVWMTPAEEDGRVYLNKIPGTFIAVYVPKQGS